MAGPRPHSECVDGASVLRVVVGRPGRKQERDEVSICSWLTITPRISPGPSEEGWSCPSSPGLILPSGTPVLTHQPQGSLLSRPCCQSTCPIPSFSEPFPPSLALDATR